MVLQMEPKVFILSAIVFALLLMGTTNAEDSQVIVEANNVTHKQIIPNNPIVIQTQLDNYEQPTLKEYQECHENAEKCRKVCEGVENIVACAKQCPICPELIKEEQLVQGVNDTQIVNSKPLNTTNIIRLTNQIHNIIDNSHGNITYHNDNTLHFYQNMSLVGGKFGLGYNNTDPCCIILRPKQNCDMAKFSTASRCHRKRHRVCGEQCKSRVMIAKRMTVCNQQPDPLDYFEENAVENCHQTIKYVPYRQRRSIRNMSKCGYIPYWPFVACAQRQHYQSGANCGDCLRLPYAYILRNGIPMQCRSCFSTYGRSNFNDGYMFGGSYPEFGWHPPMGTPVLDPPIIDNDIEFDNIGDWKEDKTKCILPDGSVSDDCFEPDGSGGDSPIKSGPENEYEYSDYDYLNGPIVRKRRQTFSRSRYSRRYRHATT